MKATCEGSQKDAANTKKNGILLVDADGDCMNIVSEAAAGSGGEVLLANTSREAFEILRTQLRRLNLVIVDVDPGAHCMALLEAISGCADKPPIMVITGLEEIYMKPIALEHGAAACVGKPILIQKLRTVMNNAPTHSRTCDRWGFLVPSKYDGPNVKACFRGIAAKLSPTSLATDLSN